jgi:hypothetical protein
MAIPIIGAARQPEKEPSPLKEIDADLPPPKTAPPGKRPIGEELVRKLLHDPRAVVRTYAIEQALHFEDAGWIEQIIPLIDDTDGRVATDAIHAMEIKKHKGAVDAIARRFMDGPTEVVAVAASALGELAPDRLLESFKQRKRLDDEGYAATASAIACIGSPEVVDFLDKAMNRSGVLAPERRGALYGAALLSGSPELSSRVIGLALVDSKNDEPEGASYPTRSALAAVAGAPLPFSRKAAGLELYDHVRASLEGDVLPLMPEQHRQKLEQAISAKRPGDLLDALAPVLDVPPRKESGSEYGNMPQRRRGLLTALLGRKEEIGALDLKAAAVFLAAAAQAAIVILAGEGHEEATPALSTLSKALESAIDAKKLASMSEDELVALFREKQEHQMRRVLGVLTHESMRHASTLQRFTNAIVRAGHGQALFEAASEVEDATVHAAVVESLGGSKDGGAEEIVLEALMRSPLDPKLARLALQAADEVRTERIALAIGRRFVELREIARTALIRAALRIGDARLIPVLEGRAFRDEPEEFAWALLTLVHGQQSDRAVRVLERGERDAASDEAGALRLPLRCKRCKEALTYAFERALLDLESKDPYGDPAFVGSLQCKACGAEEQLEPTEEAARILTVHMLEFLQESRRGQIAHDPLVAPAQTQVRGKRMGFAAALRQLDQEIKETPSAIRARLGRGRLRLLLKRKGVDEDAKAVLEADSRSAEGHMLMASSFARGDDFAGAIDAATKALRSMAGDPPSRMYDTDDGEGFRQNIEDYVVELSERNKLPLPEDLDLTKARARRAEREKERQRRIEEARAAASARAGRDEEPEPRMSQAALAEAFAKAGRNDPCPCGSGQKFKKCHGKGR